MLAALATPLALLFLLTLLGLIRLWWKRGEGRRRVLGAAVPFLLAYLLSTPPASYLALHSLEQPYPPSEEVPANAEAIVVLAGSVRIANSVRPQPELGPDTLYRCLRAAALHRKAPHLPVVVSGGTTGDDEPAYAHVMRDFLLGQSVKAPGLIVEDRSRNTFENAVECGRLLRQRGITRVVLVTSASHMRRAAGCFRAQGFEVTPSACNHLETEYRAIPSDTIPSARSIVNVDTAFHEWVGLLVYRLRGRL
jgi:uncharacterized SAM-binding protein YcdF (DUF218 family)